MSSENFWYQLNIFAQCRKYGISVWQCPQFLFSLMGMFIIGSSLFAYALGNRVVEDPLVVALIVILLSIILLIITVIITNSFERLAEANRMKSEFVSIVSHQLGTPLSNLKWATELLTSGRLGKIEENQLEYFKIIKENSGRMRELVSDLLIVSRIEQKGLSLKREDIVLEELISGIVERFIPLAKASNVEIKFEPQLNLPKIFSDPSQIKLVIENLLENAVRYIKDQGQVIIKLEKQSRDFYIEVKDTGVGISKKDQKHIFQKFFRSKNILRYQTQGSGLGLYITKAVVEKLGGKMNFQSQEGVGSTFWFTLPIIKFESKN